MNRTDHRWALVLAAGEGQRLRGLTTTCTGVAIPKQFCSLQDGPSLLDQAVQRAASAAAPERICAVVAAQHRRWWAEQLGVLPPKNIIVQPRNRGTGNGILLPLLKIIERDPNARITIFPADHYVSDEAQLGRSLRIAADPQTAGFARECAPPADILLLGITPRGPDPELGYIVPRRDPVLFPTDRILAHLGVERFVEKPPAALAGALVAGGALWNAFIIAADAQALVRLFEQHRPDVVAAMREALRCPAALPGLQGATRDPRTALDPDSALAQLYEQLPAIDFSRDMLEGRERELRVLAVSECGWSDLGTPQRVAETLYPLRPANRPERALQFGRRTVLSLAEQYHRLHGAPASA